MGPFESREINEYREWIVMGGYNTIYYERERIFFSHNSRGTYLIHLEEEKLDTIAKELKIEGKVVYYTSQIIPNQPFFFHSIGTCS